MGAMVVMFTEFVVAIVVVGVGLVGGSVTAVHTNKVPGENMHIVLHIVYFTILYYTILYCTVLYCIVL